MHLFIPKRVMFLVLINIKRYYLFQVWTDFHCFSLAQCTYYMISSFSDPWKASGTYPSRNLQVPCVLLTVLPRVLWTRSASHWFDPHQHGSSLSEHGYLLWRCWRVLRGLQVVLPVVWNWLGSLWPRASQIPASTEHSQGANVQEDCWWTWEGSSIVYCDCLFYSYLCQVLLIFVIALPWCPMPFSSHIWWYGIRQIGWVPFKLVSL